MERHIKVKLKKDLTKYNPGLVSGVEGHTIGHIGLWSRNSDRFVEVCFSGIATLSVLWDSLDIIDEDYLIEIKVLKEKQENELKSAYNVVRFVGPRGGFRHLTFKYISEDGIVHHEGNGDKQDSERLMSIFAKYGIEIRTEIQQ